MTRKALGLSAVFALALGVSGSAFYFQSTIVAAVVTPALAAEPTNPAGSPDANGAPTMVRAEGRVITAAGGRVTLGAETTGTVDKVLVEEGSVVKAGQPMVVFRGAEQRALANEAWANAREAEASARFFGAEVKRVRSLVASGSLPQQALDNAVRDRDVARARKAAALAGTSRFAAALARNTLVSPIDGTVIMRAVERGETTTAGSPLLVVADLTRLRVEAEVDELDAMRVRRGMAARISVDGVERPLPGHVTEIADAVGPRGLRPQDPARPTDAQVLRVKVELDAQEVPLKLGQRVAVTLEGIRVAEAR